MDEHDDDLDPFASRDDWGLPAESRAVLAESLRSDDPEVRREAVEMLAHSIDDELALQALEMARRDPDEGVRAAAVGALAPAVAATMTAQEAGDGSAPLSAPVFETLRQGLRHLYFDSGSPKEVRRLALECAAQAPEAWLEGAVRAAWASDDVEWRGTAVYCMTRLPGFADELLEALRDRQPAVRLQAARAAGDATLQAAAPRLLALARAADEEALVRMAAMESLALLGDREAIAPLRDIAAAADPELSFAARTALARLAQDLDEGDEGDEDGL